MSFLPTNEQIQIAEGAQRLLAQSYSGEALKALLETTGRYDSGYWRSCSEMGWTALAIPEAYCGLGLGLIEMAMVADASGRVACGAPFLITSYMASQALLLAGAEAVRSEHLPWLASGEKIGCIAFAEDANPIPPDPQVRCEGEAVYGVKRGVLGGVHADVAVVLASGPRGPVLVLVDLSAGGVTRRIVNTFDNSLGVADLVFEGVQGRPLDAACANSVAWDVLDRAAVVVAAAQTGGAEVCTAMARDYATTRRAFGQPIGRFQAIKHKIAEMYVANEIAKANCLEAALRLDNRLPEFTALAAAARLSATQAYDFATREGVQVLGAIGATWESDMHLHMRRARSFASALGSRFVWEDRLVGALETSS